MQSTKPIRSGYQFDAKVIITMIVVTLGALAIFGFRIMTHRPCSPVKINIDAANRIDSLHFYTNMPLRFSCDAQKNDVCAWTFGTKDNKKSTGQFVSFSYNEPGQYLIRVTVNGQCSESRYITISKAPKLVDRSLMPIIICPSGPIEVGKPVEFKDSSRDARSWQWQFGETDKIDATSQQAVYIFQSPGNKTVSLVINGNTDVPAICQVIVKEKEIKNTRTSAAILNQNLQDKPTTDPLTVKVGPKKTITQTEFQALIQEVIDGTKMASDFIDYFCELGLKTPVDYKVSRSKRKQLTFEEACRELKQMKERRIKGVGVIQETDPITKCITRLTIDVSKTRL